MPSVRYHAVDVRMEHACFLACRLLRHYVCTYCSNIMSLPVGKGLTHECAGPFSCDVSCILVKLASCTQLFMTTRTRWSTHPKH